MLIQCEMMHELLLLLNCIEITIQRNYFTFYVFTRFDQYIDLCIVIEYFMSSIIIIIITSSPIFVNNFVTTSML